MKTMKNFEAAFVAAAVLATFASYATANESARIATAPIAANTIVVDAPMQVVVIKGQRLTAEQKAKLGA
jgi:Spy/CpxP family protein refolding chaperone